MKFDCPHHRVVCCHSCHGLRPGGASANPIRLRRVWLWPISTFLARRLPRPKPSAQDPSRRRARPMRSPICRRSAALQA